MISWHDLYTVMAAMVPLYVAMTLAYGSVRWWKIFSGDQCSGINRFVAMFAVPLLSFHFIANNDIYAMNFRFVAADTLQKVIMLALLAGWSNLSRNGSLEWMITIFSVSTLPNTLVMGIPLLIAMYGQYAGQLMVQVVVLQCIIWYTLLLFLFEYRAAKLLIMEQFPETAASIVSFKVDSDVMSLDGRDFLETDAEIGRDGKLHVTVRKSNASRRSLGMTPRPSNLTGAEIYSLSSTPRGSNFNHSDFYSMMAAAGGPRHSNFGPSEACGSPRFGFYPAPNPEFKIHQQPEKAIAAAPPPPVNSNINGKGGGNNQHEAAKELHMFVWSSSASPASEQVEQSEQGGGAKEIRMLVPPNQPAQINGDHNNNNNKESSEATFGGEALRFAAAEQGEQEKKEEEEAAAAEVSGGGGKQMPPASVMTRLILIMVWRKLIRNPNTYSSLIGLIWSLVSFRWHVEMPLIIKGSISILSDAGLGMAMFSLGLFMALQPKLIACGNSVATFAMAVRFLTGPAVMAVASVAVGLRGQLLHVAIVQAALPQGIVPFVFAKEYNVHPTILSTAVIFGMWIALPITLVYYIVLGL